MSPWEDLKNEYTHMLRCYLKKKTLDNLGVIQVSDLLSQDNTTQEVKINPKKTGIMMHLELWVALLNTAPMHQLVTKNVLSLKLVMKR